MTETGSFRSAPKPSSQSQGVEMCKEGKSDEYRKPAKESWHKYSLQGLSLQKFVQVVNKIIRGELRLLK
jgi:hypothetical protein